MILDEGVYVCMYECEHPVTYSYNVNAHTQGVRHNACLLGAAYLKLQCYTPGSSQHPNQLVRIRGPTGSAHPVSQVLVCHSLYPQKI